MIEDLFLYRGTTSGWPGNECLQGESITCTSTDPIVATLFAIECRSHGPGVILVAPMRLADQHPGPPNYKSIEECAINLSISPSEFAERAVLRLEIDRSIEILARLGHSWLPPRLNGLAALRDAIDESHNADLRLKLEQTWTYNRLAFEVR